jgi:hypothetical protein
MRKKYKISESYINEFWGLFTSKKTPEKLQKVIDNDPVLKQLQTKIDAIDSKSKDYLDKVKKDDPEIYGYLLKHGFVK